MWVSGLIAPSGPPGAILEAVRAGRIDVVVSWALAHEMVEVLSRPSIRAYGVSDADVDELVGLLGPFLPDVELVVSVRDADDAPVVAAALVGRAQVTISGDRDLLDDAALRTWLRDRDIEVVSPAQALRLLG